MGCAETRIACRNFALPAWRRHVWRPSLRDGRKQRLTIQRWLGPDQGRPATGVGGQGLPVTGSVLGADRKPATAVANLPGQACLIATAPAGDAIVALPHAQTTSPAGLARHNAGRSRDPINASGG